VVLIGAAAVAVVCVGWWYWAGWTASELVQTPQRQTDDSDVLTANGSSRAADSAELPDTSTDDGSLPEVAEDTGADEVLEPEPASDQVEPTTRPTDANEAASSPTDDTDSSTGTNYPALAAARRQYESGKLIEARQALNALLKTELTSAAQAEARRMLTRIADETIFSKRLVENDPLVENYTVQPNEVLIRIGQRFEVPAEILMRINGIRDARRVPAGQQLKVPRGPFNAKIYKSQFRMDVYLQDLYVRSFPVGLGVDASTPEGVWRVKNSLSNPTYYPPPSAAEKRVIAADDPKNPLGEDWIGLEYVEGEAVDTEKYGIHGTIEPDSIGKNASAGCVRMHNEDVAFVYSLLQPGCSTVTILP